MKSYRIRPGGGGGRGGGGEWGFETFCFPQFPSIPKYVRIKIWSLFWILNAVLLLDRSSPDFLNKQVYRPTQYVQVIHVTYRSKREEKTPTFAMI